MSIVTVPGVWNFCPGARPYGWSWKVSVRAACVGDVLASIGGDGLDEGTVAAGPTLGEGAPETVATLGEHAATSTRMAGSPIRCDAPITGIRS
jgi:hypothetical protein